MTADLIRTLAAVRGIAEGYYDHRGELRTVSLETVAGILRAMGVDVDDPQRVKEAIHAATGLNADHALPPAVVWRGGELSFGLAVAGGADQLSVNCMIEFENGVQEQWETPAAGGMVLLRRSGRLPPGYHRLEVSAGPDDRAESLLVVTPERCHQPRALAAEARRWGVAIQLYTLRSAGNWGMGDFADLTRLAYEAGRAGADFIGLNPLHALYAADPAHCSPYSPSSRHAFNVLYIAIEQLPDLADCPEAQARVAQSDFQAELARLRAAPLVDYAGVATLKLEILRLLHLRFRREEIAKGTGRARAFDAFRAARGRTLELHALFEALDERLRAGHGASGGWPGWPEDYRDPGGPAVAAFVRAEAERIEFHAWLQWLAESQLAAAARVARDAGMAIGLYGDYAVGVDAGGSETWANQAVYRRAAAIGAPPDALALKGQDWGIPPQDPQALLAQRYRPFIELMRDNMRHFGAVRLDHVMALYRLWWVPAGLPATAGGYVRYPVDDLLGIVALESERNGCLVVGEDMGTVPDEMREAMRSWAVFHYNVLIFEKAPDGQFRAPADWIRPALASVTTHDLPTLRSWWEGTDIELRAALDLYPGPEIRAQVEAGRAADRERLLDAMAAAGVRPRWPVDRFEPDFSGAVHAYLAATQAALVAVQAEDLLDMSDPVNVPGTSTEYPNWRRKLDADLSAIITGPTALPLLEAMRRHRPR